MFTPEKVNRVILEKLPVSKARSVKSYLRRRRRRRHMLQTADSHTEL